MQDETSRIGQILIKSSAAYRARALMLCGGLVVGGAAVAVATEDPDWLSRFGSLIVASGVFLAYRADVIQSRGEYLSRLERTVLAATRARRIVRLRQALQQRRRRRSIDVPEEDEATIQNTRRDLETANQRLWASELLMVAVGTLVWGFGDLAARILIGLLVG